MIIIFNPPTHFRFKPEIIDFLPFFGKILTGGLVIRRYFWLFMRPLFSFGGSEVAGNKTSLFFRSSQVAVYKPYAYKTFQRFCVRSYNQPPVIHFKVFLNIFLVRTRISWFWNTFSDLTLLATSTFSTLPTHSSNHSVLSDPSAEWKKVAQPDTFLTTIF